MSSRLWAHPQLLALLHAAKEAPGDDSPRLVLADWLEEHGEPERAEFARCQLRLAPGNPALDAGERQRLRRRADELLEGNGGCWMGSLWRFWMSPACWHRGLLCVGLPRSIAPEPNAASLRWVDTLVWQVTGPGSFSRLASLLELSSPNHLLLDLRRPVREGGLIEHFAAVSSQPDLRTLSVEWPLGLIRKRHGGREVCSPSVSVDFLAHLLGLPSCRRLTHLASNPSWSPAQGSLIRSLGVEPMHVDGRLWMHSLPASRFRAPGDDDPCPTTDPEIAAT